MPRVRKHSIFTRSLGGTIGYSGVGEAPELYSANTYVLADYIPKGLVLRLLGFMLLTCLLWSTYGYANFGYPNGPQVFTGEYEERCTNDGTRCGMAPIYVEDTSQLSNPAWVTWVRSWAVLFVVPGVSLSIIAFIRARELWGIWQATRRGLAVLWWVDYKLRSNLDDESLWRDRGKVAFELGRNEDAISALARAKEARIKELRANGSLNEAGGLTGSVLRTIENVIEQYDDEISELTKFLDAES